MRLCRGSTLRTVTTVHLHNDAGCCVGIMLRRIIYSPTLSRNTRALSMYVCLCLCLSPLFYSNNSRSSLAPFHRTHIPEPRTEYCVEFPREEVDSQLRQSYKRQQNMSRNTRTAISDYRFRIAVKNSEHLENDSLG